MDHKSRGPAIYRFIALILTVFLLSAPALAACLSPAGTAGRVVFDDSTATLQYCNGAAWIKFPKVNDCTGLGTTGWTTSNTGINTTVTDIAYGNGTYVAVGYFGGEKVLYSTDGVTWTGVTVEDNYWSNVQFLNGLFVATASGGTNNDRIMTSPDGINWTAYTVPDNNWFGLTFGEGVYVVVSDSPTGTDNLLTSTDAVTWTPQTVANNVWSSVAYGNGIFIALASGGTYRTMTSPDGINWTQNTTLWPDHDYSDIAFGNGIFVALVSNQNYVRTTTDGVNWTSRTIPQSSDWNDITFANGLFVAVSYDGTNRIMTSPDGINWTTLAAPADANYTGVVYGDGEFAFVSDNMPAVIRSGGCGTGQNTCSLGSYTLVTAPQMNDWRAIAYGKGLFVAGAATGTSRLMTSPDGVNWTLQTPADGVSTIIYANNQFVYQAWSSAFTSPDGINWTQRNHGFGANWFDMAYGNGTYVAVASNGNYLRSTDNGVTWTQATAPEANYWNGVTYGNGLFVAIAYNGTNRVMTSPDGVTWTMRSVPARTWQEVAYGNGRFVAVADSGHVIHSPDGINWTEVVRAGSWSAVTYANGRFMATAWTGANNMMTSVDGISWTTGSTGDATNGFVDIAYGNGRFVAVGEGGPNRVVYTTCMGNCANPAEPAGSLLYNNDRRVMQWCDGTRWQSMGPDNPGGASGGCSNPAGGAGEMMFNADHSVPQYCDGGTWRAVGPVPACPVNGLAGLWSMNEGTGTTTADSAGNGNNGTLTNGPTWTTGQIGGALAFDNTNDYVAVPNSTSLNITGQITLAAWIYKPSTPAGVYNTIIAKGNNGTRLQYTLSTWGTELLMGMCNGANAACGYDESWVSGVITTGWQHVAATYNDATNTVKLYRNGVPLTLSGNNINTMSMQSNTDGLRIGMLVSGEPGNATIDDARVYNRALTDAEIARLYNGGLGCQ